MVVAVFWLVSGMPLTASAADRPNILWISCEDISPSLGCYGDKYSTSPNIDGLAAQGVVFRRCFSHAGVCAVARSGLITGVYPVSIGSQHMRSRIVPPPNVRCFTEYLRAAGYYCTNRSKTDYNFEPPLTAWDESGRKSTDWSGRAKGQPFFSVINLTVSHESKIRAKFDKLIHDPDGVTLPPYIPDTPAARRDRARYYDIITLMDTQVGRILARLKADGLDKNTIVMFWGDHGEGLPRGKRCAVVALLLTMNLFEAMNGTLLGLLIPVVAAEFEVSTEVAAWIQLGPSSSLATPLGCPSRRNP